jgi:hypothetical protein
MILRHKRREKDYIRYLERKQVWGRSYLDCIMHMKNLKYITQNQSKKLQNRLRQRKRKSNHKSNAHRKRSLIIQKRNQNNSINFFLLILFKKGNLKLRLERKSKNIMKGENSFVQLYRGRIVRR